MTIPERNEALESVYSNFDHRFNESVVGILTSHPGMASDHTAWEFHGTVWFDGEKWHEVVRRYYSIVAQYEAETLAEVIKTACDEWGYE